MRQPEGDALASNQEARREHLRFQIMRLLQRNPQISSREIAKLIEVSNGAAHYYLNSMVELGFIRTEGLQAPRDRRRFSYTLTSLGEKEKIKLTVYFLDCKMKEYAALKLEIKELKAEIAEATRH